MNVYDFDNTIYDGESTLDFFAFCTKKYPRLIKFMPKVLIVGLKYKMCKIDGEQLKSEIEKYKDEFLKLADDMDALVKEFWDIHEKRIKKFYLANQKEDDVIISASFDFMLSEIAKRLNITNLICSKIDRETGKILYWCFGDNKVSIFKSMFGDKKIDCFYTDSMHDKPMIDIAESAFIVKGNSMRKCK